MRLVVIESPYAGDIARNLRYAKAAMRDCLCRGEAPLASHLLYTQEGILSDAVPAQREQGIAAGMAWADHADSIAFYVDLGWSTGMKRAALAAALAGRSVELRTLGEHWDGQPLKPADLSGFMRALKAPLG